MPTLGGSVFAHNAIKYDYCLKESIASLCGVCDKVVALDASSDDGTLDLMHECQKEFPNLQVVHGMPWNCAPNYERLAILANKAKEFLDTDWHFMLQADEVIHEKSYLGIKKAINNQKGFDSFLCRRINLFGDMYHYLKFDLPQSKKPCSDAVNRLAHLHYGAIGDAESLGTNGDTCCPFKVDEIQIWHYGLVRDSHIMCDKVIDMQSWFFGEGGQPDHRVVESKNTTGIFEWKKFKDRSDIDRIPWKHPKVSQEWANKRQADKEPVV